MKADKNKTDLNVIRKNFAKIMTRTGQKKLKTIQAVLKKIYQFLSRALGCFGKLSSYFLSFK